MRPSTLRIAYRRTASDGSFLVGSTGRASAETSFFTCRFAADPSWSRRSLVSLNQEAVAHLRERRNAESVVSFAKLFARAASNNLTARDMYVAHNNRAGLNDHRLNNTS